MELKDRWGNNLKLYDFILVSYYGSLIPAIIMEIIDNKKVRIRHKYNLNVTNDRLREIDPSKFIKIDVGNLKYEDLSELKIFLKRYNIMGL